MSQVNSRITAHVQYACCYWIDHLLGKPSSSSTQIDLPPPDREAVNHFFFTETFSTGSRHSA